MNIEAATVLSTERAWDGALITWFQGPQLAAHVEPGQFVMVHCSVERMDPMFARAFSYYRLDKDRFALLYNVIGKGTRWLAERQRGDQVRMFGPLGNGFRLPSSPSNLLLVGGGVGIAPLVDT
ncbi:MAG: dihydroorotate dehydrogenase electron transfer subunit, partial [Tepidiformaceae bacterium]